MKTLNKDLSSNQLNQTIEQLEQLLFCDLVMIYNDYADAMSYERIYDNDEYTLNEVFNSPYDAIQQTNNDGYNDNDDYFVFNGCGHAVSFSYQLVEDENNPIDIEELAQWIINEDKLTEYDITVTTLEDMLASIEDNITDDKYLLSKLCDYLGQTLSNDKIELLKTDDDYYEYLVNHAMNEISDYDYNDLYEMINKVGIEYSNS